jgi:hypothetical protein
MTPEEAYEIARRRILKAEETGALELDLSGWIGLKDDGGFAALNRLPRELANLISLHSGFFLLRAARRRLCKGAPGSGLFILGHKKRRVEFTSSRLISTDRRF